MSINLKKMTESYKKMEEAFRKLREARDLIKDLETTFDFIPYDGMIDVAETWSVSIKHSLKAFLVNRYQKTFCPNVNLGSLLRSDFYDDPEFDATKIINYLNSLVLVDPERLAYDHLLESARKVIDSDFITDYKLFVTKGTAIMLRIRTYSSKNTDGKRKRYAHVRSFYDFEKFSTLLLRNSNLFDKVAPSQIKSNLPISNSAHGAALPFFVRDRVGVHKGANFYANGRVDFFYNTVGDLNLVLSALKGDPPKVYFPEHKIDPDQLFIKEEMRLKRVVKMIGEKNGG